MKIFDKQPIRVLEYLMDPRCLEEKSGNSLYDPQFTFGYQNIESVDVVTILFNMRYCVGIHDEQLFQYCSYSQFGFIPEGFLEDLKSIENYLEQYYLHTEKFMSLFVCRPMKEIEKDYDRRLYFNAVGLLEMLQSNGKYPFKIPVS